MLDVESTLINTVKEKLGSGCAEDWLNRLDTARKEEEIRASIAPSRFVAGLPKGEHWIRILLSDELVKKDVQKLADELGLSHETHKDGHILLHGQEEKVKVLVKKMAEKCRRTRKS